MPGNGDALTVLMPTRNRPQHCARQLNFLRANGLPYRIVVLDGSLDAAVAAEVQTAASGLAEYRRFDPAFRMADKLAAAIGDVATPFVILIPDDDLVLPHAIEAEIRFLRENPAFIAAHGYFLSFALHDNDVDISRVIGFTASITDENPLRRHYELFRRYQSFYWGVFRTPIFASAVTAAIAMEMVVFRETTVMSIAILQGKVARLRLIHALRGTAPSHAPLRHSNPFFWALHDAASFFSGYAAYREVIVSFIRSRAIAVPDGTTLEQLLDMSHASWLAREIDTGKINHTVRLLLGDPLPPVDPPDMPVAWQEPTQADEISPSGTVRRRYVWRQSVIAAEPRDEITIDRDERARVERQLDVYR
jgi:glycosyltransferase domain-containing protein